jgi:hypothetical protein
LFCIRNDDVATNPGFEPIKSASKPQKRVVQSGATSPPIHQLKQQQQQQQQLQEQQYDQKYQQQQQSQPSQQRKQPPRRTAPQPTWNDDSDFQHDVAPAALRKLSPRSTNDFTDDMLPQRKPSKDVASVSQARYHEYMLYF